MTADQAPVPEQIKLHQHSRLLELCYADGTVLQLSCELLRVYSPSAEVRGHGPKSAVLQVDKEHVNIKSIEPVGNYAVKLVFDDGHDTGIYSWEYLYDLGQHAGSYWQEYLEALKAAGHHRGESP